MAKIAIAMDWVVTKGSDGRAYGRKGKRPPPAC